MRIDQQAVVAPAGIVSGVSTGATIFVAASNAAAGSRGAADYVCDGTSDEAEINAAIAALPDYGGRVLLSEGLFTIGSPIVQYRDGVTLAGTSSGHPTGGPIGSYASGAVTSGTLIRPAAAFSGAYALDCRVTGNVITALAGALAGGETTIPLASVAGMATSGSVIVYSGNPGAITVSYTGISGSSLTGCSGAVAAPSGARVNYGARTLFGIALRDFSLDGYGSGSPFADASGLLFQTNRSYVQNVKVVRFRQNGIVVDGGGRALGTLGGFDNRFTDFYVEKCGGDAIQEVAGASDNIWTSPIVYGQHPTLGRYGMYIESSPGTIIHGGHFALLNDTAIVGSPRQLRVAGGTRFTDCAKGGIYLAGFSNEGAGFLISATFRDMATGNAGSYDAINIAPAMAVRGGIIGPCEFNNYADANAVRYLINIANANATDMIIGPYTVGYTTPATKAYTAAAVNNAGTNVKTVTVA